MQFVKLIPLVLLPIHFFVYLISASLGLSLFNFDALYLGFFFGIPFWWVIVYPLYSISNNGVRWSLSFSIIFSLIVSLSVYGFFSFDVAPNSTVVAGSEVYVTNGTLTISYIKSVVGQIGASIVGVAIGAPLFAVFLRNRKN